MNTKQKRTYPSLRRWRLDVDINQHEAARRLGVSQSVYSKYERGANTPRPERAVIISAKTGVPFENLMGVA